MIPLPRSSFALLVLTSFMLACNGSSERPAPRTSAVRSPAGASAEDPSLVPPTSSPLAPLAPYVGGAWRVTMQSGTSMDERWSWGPGHRSILIETAGEDGGGNAWRAWEALFVDPRSGTLRTLGLSPDIPGLGRSVSEGVVAEIDAEIDAERFVVHAALHQPGHPGRAVRTLLREQVLDGPDRYTATLRETDGEGNTGVLGTWTYERVPAADPGPPLPPEALRPHGAFVELSPWLGKTWSAEPAGGAAGTPGTRTSFAWVPLVGAGIVRVVDASTSAPLVVATLYHHVGDGEERCLVLTDSGKVLEGSWGIDGAGTLRLDLRGAGEDRLLVTIAPGEDGAVMEKVVRRHGDERTTLRETTHVRSPSAATPPR